MAVQQYLMMGRAAAGRSIITGEQWYWGSNSYGVGGLGTDTVVSDITQVGSLTNWQNTMIPCGGGALFHGTVKSDGTLWMQGRNIVGQLGQGNTTNQSSPVQVGSLTDWLEVACYSNNTAAIKTDGTLWAWGGNEYGMCGDGTTTNRSSPVQAGSDTDWAHVIQMNSDNMVAMKTNGALYYAGLQTATAIKVSVPTQIGSETDFVDAIGQHGGLVAWKEA